MIPPIIRVLRSEYITDAVTIIRRAGTENARRTLMGESRKRRSVARGDNDARTSNNSGSASNERSGMGGGRALGREGGSRRKLVRGGCTDDDEELGFTSDSGSACGSKEQGSKSSESEQEVLRASTRRMSSVAVREQSESKRLRRDADLTPGTSSPASMPWSRKRTSSSVSSDDDRSSGSGQLAPGPTHPVSKVNGKEDAPALSSEGSGLVDTSTDDNLGCDDGVAMDVDSPDEDVPRRVRHSRKGKKPS